MFLNKPVVSSMVKANSRWVSIVILGDAGINGIVCDRTIIWCPTLRCSHIIDRILCISALFSSLWKSSKTNVKGLESSEGSIFKMAANNTPISSGLVALKKYFSKAAVSLSCGSFFYSSQLIICIHPPKILSESLK